MAWPHRVRETLAWAGFGKGSALPMLLVLAVSFGGMWVFATVVKVYWRQGAALEAVETTLAVAAETKQQVVRLEGQIETIAATAPAPAVEFSGFRSMYRGEGDQGHVFEAVVDYRMDEVNRQCTDFPLQLTLLRPTAGGVQEKVTEWVVPARVWQAKLGRVRIGPLMTDRTIESPGDYMMLQRVVVPGDCAGMVRPPELVSSPVRVVPQR